MKGLSLIASLLLASVLALAFASCGGTVNPSLGYDPNGNCSDMAVQDRLTLAQEDQKEAHLEGTASPKLQSAAQQLVRDAQAFKGKYGSLNCTEAHNASQKIIISDINALISRAQNDLKLFNESLPCAQVLQAEININQETNDYKEQVTKDLADHHVTSRSSTIIRKDVAYFEKTYSATHCNSAQDVKLFSEKIIASLNQIDQMN